METSSENPFAELEELLPQLHGFASKPLPELNFFAAGGQGFAENPISDMMALFMGGGRGVPPWLAKALVRCLPPELTADCIEQVNWENVYAEREVCKSTEDEGTKRLDIVLTTDQFILGIENKVFANASHNPFDTYTQLLNERTVAAGGLPVFKCLIAPKDVTGRPSDWLLVRHGELHEQALAQWGKESAATPFGKWHVFYQEFLSHLNTVAHPERSTRMDDAAQTFVKEHFSALRQAQAMIDEFDRAIGEQGREAVGRGLEEETHIKLASSTWDEGGTKIKRFFPASWGGNSQVIIGYYQESPDDAKEGMLGWFIRAYLNIEEFDLDKYRKNFESLTTKSKSNLPFYPRVTSANYPKGTWPESKGKLLALDASPSVYTQKGALDALEALTRWVNTYRHKSSSSE